MVDEVQTVEPRTLEARALFSLHADPHPGLAVLPVFAGLGNLPAHLRQRGIGISRFADELKCRHALCALSRPETGELLRGWLDHFGVGAQAKETAAWEAALWGDTGGWPMHAHHFLAALASSLAARKERPDLARTGLGEVRRAAARERAAYYGSRLREAPARSGLMQLMAAQRLDGPLNETRCLSLLGSDRGNMDAALQAFDELTRLGFLQQDTRGEWSCPIPSLAGFSLLGALRDSAAHEAALFGDDEGLRRALRREPSLLKVTDPFDRTPLHVAAEGRWRGVFDLLLEAGADSGAKDAMGRTADDIWHVDAP